MSRHPTVLSLSVLASLALQLQAASAGPRWQVYVFKPLTTILVMAVAWIGARAGRTRGEMDVRGDSRTQARYVKGIGAGLLCSLAGDVWLTLPGDHFLPGLVSFLLAHACYIVAFASRAGRLTPAPTTLPYALAYVLLVGILAPHVGGLLGPVSLYGVALVGMAWTALEAWRARPCGATAAAAIGGVLFVASDALLAYDRFVAPVPYDGIAIMATYVAAQYLIARSV